MRVAKDQGSKLHHGDKSGEILDFSVWISAIENSREIEELCALIDFGPKPLLEGFFGRPLDCNLLDEIEVS